ncbi:MAG TPA: hypothetical protein VG408_03860 [Actinomycetota bacterium]|nr:hypothetical protein [Actinomycetota bacterium]
MTFHRRVASVTAPLIALAALPLAVPGLFVGAGATPAGTREVRAAPHVVVGRWTVRVSLSRRRIGPLRLRTGRVQRAPDTSSKPWVQHELRIRNVGLRQVRLGDTRTSRYLRGPVGRALLGADEGCGYGIASGSDEIDVGLCASYLDVPTLRPGERIRRTVTLFKGLKGMTSLRAGTYVFPKRISYKVSDRRTRVRRLRVVYKIVAR